MEDVNRMVRHCFTLDQQQKITRSKYITDKGYAVLDESNQMTLLMQRRKRAFLTQLSGCRKRNAGQLSLVKAITHLK